MQRARGLGRARLANLFEPQARRDNRVDVVGQFATETRDGELLDLRGVGCVAELPAIDPRVVVKIVRDGEFDDAARIVSQPAEASGREARMQDAERERAAAA